MKSNLKSSLVICFTVLSIASMIFYQARYPVVQAVVDPIHPPIDDIAKTIEDERSRGIISTYCDAWAQSMKSVVDLGHYYRARKIADIALQSASKLPPGLEDFDAALAKRLEKAVGLDPSRIDLEPVAVVFRQVSKELE